MSSIAELTDVMSHEVFAAMKESAKRLKEKYSNRAPQWQIFLLTYTLSVTSEVLLDRLLLYDVPAGVCNFLVTGLVTYKK
jgi:hypothetical protein